MKVLYILAGLVAVGAVAYLASHTVRGWVRATWDRWFKDSEVNLGADIMTVLGIVGTVAEDPSTAALFEMAHVSPSTLLTIGLIVRTLKASRNVGALPFTRSSDDAG